RGSGGEPSSDRAFGRTLHPWPLRFSQRIGRAAAAARGRRRFGAKRHRSGRQFGGSLQSARRRLGGRFAGKCIPKVTRQTAGGRVRKHPLQAEALLHKAAYTLRAITRVMSSAAGAPSEKESTA